MTADITRFAKPEETQVLSDLALRSKSIDVMTLTF